jgi:hypothetical protein
MVDPSDVQTVRIVAVKFKPAAGETERISFPCRLTTHATGLAIRQLFINNLNCPPVDSGVMPTALWYDASETVTALID